MDRATVHAQRVTVKDYITDCSEFCHCHIELTYKHNIAFTGMYIPVFSK